MAEFVITGISRSGTSLLVALLNKLPNVVCFNEVLARHPVDLPDAFIKVRKDIRHNRPITNKYLDDKLTTDTLIDGVAKQKRVYHPKFEARDIHLGNKRNLSYLNQLDTLLSLGYPVVAMVRDPRFTLASWGSPRADKSGIPGARVDDPGRHPHLQHIHLDANASTLTRRAIIWEHYANILWTHKSQLMLVRFEQLCQNPIQTLANVAKYLGVYWPDDFTLPQDFVSQTRNDPARYAQSMEAITQVIQHHCPTRLLLNDQKTSN